MIKIKSALIKFPLVFEAIQGLRNRRFHREGLRCGTFSQHGEDLRLLATLQDADAKGPYLDVGCNHPFRLSNTYLLYQKGWRGLCIDPLPQFRDAFQHWRPQDIFHCAAVGETAIELPFFEFESDVLSTFDVNLADAYRARGFRLLRKLMIPVVTIDSVLEFHGLTPPLSLLSLDIEGHELSALRSINLQYWRPMFICMEALTADGSRNETAIQYLLEQGYRPIVDMGLNIVYQKST